MSVSAALSLAFTDAPFERVDAAAIAIAHRLAHEIDSETDPKTVGDLATKLLAVLTALGLTPAARNGIVKGANDDGPRAGNSGRVLAELRERSGARRVRLHAAPNLDTPS